MYEIVNISFQVKINLKSIENCDLRREKKRENTINHFGKTHL